MNKILNMILRVGRHLLLKLKIVTQSIGIEKTVKNYSDAVLILNQNTSNCEATCIREKENEKKWNYQLSIIIPAYNCEKYIKKCINSVLSQEIKYTYEIIVVNDGSTDDTQNILNQYRNIKNIHIIEQDNKGFSGARNTGIDFATGRYLMFLDSDDEILENGMETLLERAYTYDADIVEGGARWIYSNDKYIDKPCSDVVKEIANPLGILEGYFWGKVYKSELFDGIRLPEGYWFEDSLNAHVLFWKCKRCILVPELVYAYYQNENGITHSSRKKIKSIDSLYVTESLIKDHLQLGYEINLSYYEYFLRMIKVTYYRTREMNEEIRNSIFVCQCKLYETYFKGFSTEVKEMKKLEKAIRNNNYMQYVISLEW